MCGIAGFLGDWTSRDLQRMGRFLRHRGPDDSGQFEDSNARLGLFHARLSIIDITGGRQPLQNEDGSIIVVFNGEIYNHQQLRRDLKKRGHQLASESDGEVIAHLYEEFGIDLVTKLRGMFAIALWDNRNQKLFLIRDRFGIKPLYYLATKKGTLFASEVKAILGVNRVRDIDFQAMEWYLSFRYVPEDRTMFRGIKKLRPGHWMEISAGGSQVQCYWDLRQIQPSPPRSERDWSSELLERLREAVDIRLMSDVPLGAFLSGGLDSSFIVGLMSGISDKPVETFSFGVGTGWHNETDYAELVARTFRTSHHSLEGSCEEPAILKQAIWHLDEPLADTAIIPTYLLSRLTRQHVTVALTGEGADELLGGYDKYKILYFGDKFSRGAPRALLSTTARWFSRWPKPHRGLRFLSQVSDRAKAYVELISVFNDTERQHILEPALTAQLNEQEPALEVIRRILAACHGPSYLDDLMHIDLQTWLVNDVLLKADKMSMAHGLEARVPFLDHEFAEFCASMPSSLKLKGWREKHILREAMQNLVPERIIKRKKHGFTVSLVPWTKGGEASMLNTVLSQANLQKRGWFNSKTMNRLLKTDMNNPFIRRQAFALLVLEIWAQLFLDTPEISPNSVG